MLSDPQKPFKAAPARSQERIFRTRAEYELYLISRCAIDVCLPPLCPKIVAIAFIALLIQSAHVLIDAQSAQAQF